MISTRIYLQPSTLNFTRLFRRAQDEWSRVVIVTTAQGFLEDLYFANR